MRRAKYLARLYDRVLSVQACAPRNQGNDLSIWDKDSPADCNQVEHAFQDLNIIYCELTALLVLVSFRRPSGDISRKARFPTSRSTAFFSHVKYEGKLTLQAGLVRTYVTSLLQGEDHSGAHISRPLIPTMYTALLPTIWALLNQPKESYTRSQGEAPIDTVLSAMLDQAIKTTSKSAVKALTVEFIARILLVCVFPHLSMK